MFVKHIENGPKNIKNLIKSRLTNLKFDVAGRENGVRLQKEA